jgi:hypothetical protein
MPSLTKEIPFESDLHKMVLKSLSSRIDLAEKGFSSQRDKFTKAEDTVLAYIPESDMDKKRRSARENRGEPKYTTIKLPYTYALLMSAHTYLTSVFFGRTPVHQFAGRHGETEEQCDALEALIGYQVQVGTMLGPYYIWLYDTLKYGAGAIEEYWCDEQVQFTTIEEAPDPTDPMGEKTIKQQVRVTMPGYSGNRIANIRPTDFLPDPRLPVGRFQEGEFVFVRKKLSWETIVKRQKQGYYMNIDALKGASRSSNYFAAGQNQRVASNLQTPEDNMTIVDTSIEGSEHPAVVYVYEGCVSIIPAEWKLGNSDFPEKWMFTITQDKSTIMGAQPHGAMHCKFPYEVLEAEVEGYGTWGRGLPDVIEPVQNTLDWLINQHFFNVRAALNNQFIIDPSKIVAKDAEDGGPGFVYRLRPEAYGTDVRQYFHQVPVADMTRGHVADMQTMLGIGERITGINDQIMGVLNAGGRKTATEVRTSTGFGVNRMKTLGEYMSGTGFSNHAQKLVQNTQQYYQDSKKFKIAGNLLTDMQPGAAKNFMQVDPQTIQGFYDFVPVDGTLPVDRLALANLWKELLLQMRTVPGLTMQFDLGRIFAHVANLAGIRNLNQFKIQVGSPESLLQQADKGNIVPIRPGGTGNSNPAGVGSPGVSPLG